MILIDDGSPDKSGFICDKYALKDNRIKVIHKLNTGVSASRNMGIKESSGSWITFIDADDYISPAFIEGLLKPIFDNPLDSIDFVQAGCLNLFKNGICEINQQYSDYYGDDINELFDKVRGLTVSKLFRRDVINKYSLLYDEKMNVGEDMAFTLDYLRYVKYFAFVSETGYFYRRDNLQSITHSKSNRNYFSDIYSETRLFNSTLELIQSRKIESQVAYNRILQRVSGMLETITVIPYAGLSYNQRINLLKNNYSDFLVYFKDYRGSFYKRLLSILMENHYYALVDFINETVYKLKKYIG